jgi:hypothetical protein
MVTYNPSSATKQIKILDIVYTTSITITYPSSGQEIAVGAPFPIEGNLVFYEGATPYGLKGMTVTFSYGPSTNPDLNSLGSTTTGDGGYYSKSVVINEVGTWTIKAKFAGGSGYTASDTTVSMKTVGEIITSTPIAIMLLAGIPVFVALNLMKRIKGWS